MARNTFTAPLGFVAQYKGKFPRHRGALAAYTEPSQNAIPLPERAHFLVRHELATRGLGQTSANRRPFFGIHDVDARSARFDLARQLCQLLLVLLRPGPHAFQDGVDICPSHRSTSYPTSASANTG